MVDAARTSELPSTSTRLHGATSQSSHFSTRRSERLESLVKRFSLVEFLTASAPIFLQVSILTFDNLELF
jgi:hypothetical protein